MEKACKVCKRIVKERKCKCGSSELVEEWKGIAIVLNPEKSEIAKEMGVKEEGVYALRIG